MFIADEDSDSLWERFDALANLSEIERQAVFYEDGLTFLAFFVSTLMSHYSLPEIDSASDFSEVIIVLRRNYKDWNQKLVGLGAVFQSGRQASVSGEIVAFSHACPWNGLSEVARSMVGNC